MNPGRNIIVVNVETSGLNPAQHTCVEIAWWNLDTNRRDRFIPKHDVRNILATADLKALLINRYIDRIADQPQDDDYHGMKQLAVQLNGATLAGSNPAFDAAFLRPLFLRCNSEVTVPEWHHRMLDLSAYAAGVLRLAYLPGLQHVSELLGVTTPDHTAEGDVTATGECFRELFKRAGVSL